MGAVSKVFDLAAVATLLAITSCAHAVNGRGSQALPRIAIRQQPTGPVFYETTSGERFTPQGVNWVKLEIGDQKWPANVSFSPGYFKAHFEEIRRSIQAMAKLGYNVIRIRLDAKGISGPKNGKGLDPKYVDNLINFIRMANQENIYVLLTGQWLPENYYSIAYTKPDARIFSQTSGVNQLLLSKELTRAFGQYESDLIGKIKEQAPELLSGVFAFDIWNEQSFSAKDLPFSKLTGTFISDDGKTYDLSDWRSRQDLADDASSRWVNEVTSAIKSVDPAMLVTSSVFDPLEVRRTGYDGVYLSGSSWGDWRQPFRLKALEKTNLDFLEIHPYPHALNYSFASDLESLEFPKLKRNKPILIGEFGTFKKDFPRINDAIAVAKSFLAQACREGLSGWLFWTWDTYEQNRKDDLWNMTDNDFAIANAISPRMQDWCLSTVIK
jgi:hypothetical protein